MVSLIMTRDAYQVGHLEAVVADEYLKLFTCQLRPAALCTVLETGELTVARYPGIR